MEKITEPQRKKNGFLVVDDDPALLKSICGYLSDDLQGS